MTLHGNCLWYPDQMVLSLLPEYAEKGLDRKGLQSVAAARQAMMEATQVLQLRHESPRADKSKQQQLSEKVHEFQSQVRLTERLDYDDAQWSAHA